MGRHVFAPPPIDPIVAQRERDAQARKVQDAINGRIKRAMVPDLYADAELVVPDGLTSEEESAYGWVVDELRAINPGGGIFLLMGNRGTGKSHLACAKVLRACEEGVESRYAEAGDYFLALDHGREKESRSALEVEAEYLKPALLVLDAMEERADTPAKDRMLTRLINKRYVGCKTTLLVTNEGEELFKNRVGPTIADRIHDGGGVIECDWPSLRGRVQR